MTALLNAANLLEADTLREASDFLQRYQQETGQPDPTRLEDLRREMTHTGKFELSFGELEWAARVAWRNSTRCVGRLYWPALEVRDLRHVTGAQEVFGHLRRHLHDAQNRGNLRPIISIFGAGVEILSPQLLRYADDPANAELCRVLEQLGWRARGERFELLPVAIRGAGQAPQLFDLQPEEVLEVPIQHPEFPALAELGLKWHALPLVSDLSLDACGMRFAAPFNGWYMQTEIAARNLADQGRYNVLPDVARALGIATRHERSLWRDRALLELNIAVLFSFEQAGVKIVDHHTAAQHFVRFEEKEAQAGREVRGRWSWLIPPLSPATTPIWERQYNDEEERPNFARCPYH